MSELSPDKRALLALRLRQRQEARELRAAGPWRRPGDGPFPLSLAQQRMWLLDQVNPGVTAYNAPRVLRLRGQLDVRALEHALSRIVARHDALRTAMRIAGGKPVQRVCPPYAIGLDAADVSAEADPDGAARALAIEALRLPFDLASGELMRARLIRLGPEDHVLALVLHHAASDEASKAVLFDDLAVGYGAAHAGRELALPDPPLRYVDCAAWEREQIDAETVMAHLRWWRDQLEDAPSDLGLPHDRPRPPVFGFAGACHRETVEATTLAGLQALARQEGVTLFIVLVAAYKVLLERYSGQADVVVAVPTSGRSRPEHHAIIGMFGNTIVLRTQLAGTLTFRELVSRVRATVVDAFAHEVPFERLAQEVGSGRDQSHFPIAEAMFNFFDDPSAEAPRLEGLVTTPFEVDPGEAQIDLGLTASVRADGLRLFWEYSSELFDARTIARMTVHLRRLLGAVAANPSVQLSQLTLAGPEEIARLDELNATATRIPDLPVHEIVAARARELPDALAVRCAGSSLTYRQLDERANRLAHALVAAGAGPGVLVGVRIDRSVDLLVAIHGVLRAGAAYVPLDPDYPRERVELMLADARAPLLVTRSDLCDELHPSAAAVVCVDDPMLERQPVGAPPSRAGLDDLAYAIFTSGSTGRPKGVMIEHRALVNLLSSMAEHPGLHAGETMLGLTTPAFDLSVPDLHLPLMCGATLALATPEEAADPRRLGALLTETGATVVQATPSTWQMLLDDGWRPERPMRIVVGGEAVPVALAERLAATVDEAWNFYGPTEACVWSTRWRIELPLRNVVPIGRPIANTACYVVDAYGNRSPVGVPGELWIGGHGVARGYLASPAQDGARFTSDPFAASRVYRTGDRVRVSPEGLLEFVGRLDQQIKLRGFRIELDDIARSLERHDAVREAVAIVREDEPGDRRLLAYVTVTAQGSVQPAELLAHLRRMLPSYMLPWTIVALDRMPRTPGGKLDRKALPQPVAALAGGPAPEGELEERVATIWKAVLAAPAIGRDDDFFALGGHSLAAVRVIARLNAELELMLPVRAVFDAPTVRGLARVAAGSQLDGPRATLAPLRPLSARGDRFPASSQQRRMWFLSQIESAAALYTVPICLAIDGPLDTRRLRRSLDELLDRHEALRTTLPAADGQPCQAVHPTAAFALEEVAAPDGRAAQDLLRDAVRRPFDLADGPLARGVLVRVAPDRHLLALVLHHAVVDAWSVGILMRELSVLMAGGELGPASAVQYGDYASWQQEQLDGAPHARQLAWWRAQLGGAPAEVQLPAVRPRPAASAHPGRRHVVTLPAELLDGVDALGAARGATRFMVLATAVKVLMARYGGGADVVVGTPVSGRVRPELDAVVGLFANTLVLRTSLDGDIAFVDALERVKRVTLDALAHQDVPFERVVDALVTDRDLSRNPLFQVSITVQDDGQTAPLLPGARVELLTVDRGVSPFDWSLSFARREGALHLTWDYSTELFDHPTIERCAEHLRRLLEGALTSPEAPVAELPLMSAADEQRLIGDGAATAAPVPSGTLIDHVVVRAVRQPDRPAVRCGGVTLTYGELVARADRIARLIVDADVREGAIVAIRLARSADLIAALLGVMKAGCAYLPLDPAIPELRAKHMLADSGAAAVLVDGRDGPTSRGAIGDRLPIDIGLAGAPSRGAPTRRGAAPSDPAYVIYTSGSTGVPKGVVVTHANLLNVLASTAAEPGVGPADTLLAVTTLSFDIAAFELFAPLFCGGTVVISPDGVAGDPAALTELISRSGATVMFATPSTWRMLLEAGWRGRPGLRALTGGEVLSVAVARALLDRVGELWNMYGPTETTILSTSWRVTKEDAATIPIGRPVANTACYVLDANDRPLPPEIGGELCIGGAGVARGYHERPQLTSERFVADPFVAGGRMYRTGDRVRRRRDGVLLYLGRTDDQVKLHGVRIELGEIEATLEGHPDVREAAVLLRSDEPGNHRLVGYVTGTPSPDELRAHAAASLPATMVPAQIVVLEHMPRTPNGKLDRRALPRPAATSGSAAREPPASELEERIAATWAEVLAVDTVGRDDSFFALGGHSLAAARVVARLNAELETRLPVRVVFEARTVAGMARAIEALDHGASGAPLAPVARAVGQRRVFPASSQQRRVWFLEQLDPAAALYSVPVCMRIDGPLDSGRLHRALDRLLERHEVLRATLPDSDGVPAQVVRPVVPFALEELTAPDDLAARALLESAARRSFDLATGPLARGVLVEISSQRHLLALVFHHCVIDAWSIGLVMSELSASMRGAEPAPTSDVQYGDYALWQQEQFEDSTLAEQSEWWRARLDGVPLETALPADRPRSRTTRHAGSRHVVTLPPDLLENLDALAVAHGATRFMVLTTAVQVLLARYSGDHDVVVGTPVSGRVRPELDDVVGMFVNTLVLRTSLDGDPSFEEALDRVKRVTLDALAHQDVPFERLVDDLVTTRDLNRNPLFQVAVAVDDRRPALLDLPDAHVDALDVDHGVSRFDWSLTFSGHDDGLRLSWEYSTDLFDEQTVKRCAEHLRHLLEAIRRDPSAPVSQLRLMSDEDLAGLTHDLTDTAAAIPPGALSDHVAAYAAQRPDAESVRCGPVALTYRQLDERANGIGRLLVDAGVPRGAIVAVRLRRSTDLVAALLGVMKAGCAYLALDPAMPAKRGEYLLEDSGARAVLVDGETSGAGSPNGSRPRPEAIRVADAGAAPTPPDRSPASSDAAYVIYTSGSTGQPKGVVVTHANLMNLLASQCREPGFSPADTVLAATTVTFDAAMLELLAPLLAGSCVVVVEDGIAGDPDALAELALEARATVLFLTPSMWRVLLDAGWDGRPGLRAFTGGEALSPALASRLLARVGELWNMYGPTETTILSTSWRVTGEDAATIPIGRPVANTACYVLDANDRPVPMGAVGELCIGGAGVARGYHERPQLTSERFVADPFVAGGRMYRTGDRVRRRRDGVLLYLGRTDDQVKLRGMRVELGEIEATLEGHPDVREAAVLLRSDEPGNHRLVGYVTGTPSPDELRAHAAASLPATMVPAQIVVLEHMPRTPNGKLDRRALPRPAATSGSAAREPPASELEERIAAIWEDVLGIDAIGRADDFFALGGHSLAVARVVARLNEELDCRLSVRVLFDASTIVLLARAIEALLEGPAGQGLPPVRRAGRRGVFPASSQQRRAWFGHEWDSTAGRHAMTVGMGITGPLDVEALRRSLDRLVERHEVLRTTLPHPDGMPVQVVHAAMPFALDELDAPDEAAAEDLVRSAAGRAFDLANGPLARGVLVRVSEHRRLFALVLHEAIVDTWSLRLLTDELSALMRGEDLKSASQGQYGDYARLQHDRSERGAMDDDLAWWRARLAGAPAETTLPTDRRPLAAVTHVGARHVTTLSADLVERLDALATARGATRFMVLAAALQVLIFRYGGEADVVLGTRVSGRRPEDRAVVGPFADTLVLRTLLAGDPSFDEALERVKHVTLDAFARQAVPFALVAEACAPARGLAERPLFQVLLAVDDDCEPVISVPGADVDRLDLDRRDAECDWSLVFSQRGEDVWISWTYHAARFDGATIERCATHLRRVLAAIAVDASAPISRLPLLPDAELRLLAGLDATTAEIAPVPVHDLVARSATERPDAVAVTCGAETLTYRDLDEGANRLAHQLIAAGAAPGVLVGVRIERSVELLVAIHGVLRAGAAYVPLDPDHPRERTEHVLRSSRVKLLVTRTRLRDDCDPGVATVICLDDPRLRGRPATWPQSRAGLDDLAYVIFTSGSTGRPKGVMIEHRSVANLLASLAEHPGLRSGETMLGLTTPAFDLSVPDLYLAHVCGATLALATAEEAADPRRLGRVLRETEATVVQATPSTWQMLRADGWLPERAMRIVVGGETVPVALAEWLADVMDEAWNFYGPTETCVWSTRWRIRKPLAGSTAIGRPIANTRCYVVDPAGNRVPVGVPGELWIGGAGVARGYIAASPQDDDRFGADPFSPGERIYRTGDYVRLDSGGLLDFVGRRDRQVKLRGFRIELDEVARSLDRHDAVREAVAVVCEDEPEDRRLVGYFVAEHPISEAELLEELRRTLPAHMVPGMLVELERLPLTANGKLDVAALPIPRTPEGAPMVMPRTPLEQQLVELWGEALHRPEIGIHDNLFHLGAHSLLVTRVLAQISDAIGVDVPLRRVYEEPTVAEIAGEIVSLLLIDAHDDLDALLSELERSP